MIKCKNCGRENDNSFAYCLDCGSVLKSEQAPGAAGTTSKPSTAAVETHSCPKCGTQVKADDAFCLSCGEPLGPKTKGRTKYMHAAPPEAARQPRAQLVLIRPDGTEGTVFTLAEKATIGRSQGIIMFPKDPFVAPKHAEFEFKGGQLIIYVLDSLNGVYHRMTREAQIYPGAYFRIGRQLLRLEVPSDFLPLDIKAPEGDDSLFWGSPTPQVWARLIQVLEGGKIGEIHLLTQPEVVLGREEGEVRFPEDGFISSRHCMLVNKDGDCFVRDLDSSNGTYLRIHKKQVLDNEDRIQIGNQVLKVVLS